MTRRHAIGQVLFFIKHLIYSMHTRKQSLSGFDSHHGYWNTCSFWVSFVFRGVTFVIAEGGLIQTTTLRRIWCRTDAKVASWVACFPKIVTMTYGRNWFGASTCITACWGCRFEVVIVTCNDEGSWINGTRTSIDIACSEANEEKQQSYLHQHQLFHLHLSHFLYFYV